MEQDKLITQIKDKFLEFAKQLGKEHEELCGLALVIDWGDNSTMPPGIYAKINGAAFIEDLPIMSVQAVGLSVSLLSRHTDLLKTLSEKKTRGNNVSRESGVGEDKEANAGGGISVS